MQGWRHPVPRKLERVTRTVGERMGKMRRHSPPPSRPSPRRGGGRMGMGDDSTLMAASLDTSQRHVE
eukprot:1371067-Pyramimonas_sp.AAC.1